MFCLHMYTLIAFGYSFLGRCFFLDFLIKLCFFGLLVNSESLKKYIYSLHLVDHNLPTLLLYDFASLHTKRTDMDISLAQD